MIRARCWTQLVLPADAGRVVARHGTSRRAIVIGGETQDGGDRGQIPTLDAPLAAFPVGRQTG
jgi:hypothetical protein